MSLQIDLRAALIKENNMILFLCSSLNINTAHKQMILALIKKTNQHLRNMANNPRIQQSALCVWLIELDGINKIPEYAKNIITELENIKKDCLFQYLSINMKLIYQGKLEKVIFHIDKKNDDYKRLQTAIKNINNAKEMLERTNMVINYINPSCN